jgi:hypothetical protein
VILNCFNDLLRNIGAFLRYEENYPRRAMFKTFCSFLLSTLIYLNTARAVTGIAVFYDPAKNAVSIKWQPKATDIKKFVIQRSDDNSTWTDIGSVEATVPAKPYQYFDRDPAGGQNYYRLKSILSNSQIEYSPSVMVITGEKNSGEWVMYPVPVTNLLTLQYKGTKRITGVVNVSIQNVTGYTVTKIRSASLNTVIRIPVDNLGKGIYDVRIVIEDEVVWNQRFVK